MEDQQCLEEMAAKEETVLERQAKMRERAKHLKEKREAERLTLVQEKLEQQWRFVTHSSAFLPLGHVCVCLSVHPSIILDCEQLYIPQPHFTCQIIDIDVLI